MMKKSSTGTAPSIPGVLPSTPLKQLVNMYNKMFYGYKTLLSNRQRTQRYRRFRYERNPRRKVKNIKSKNISPKFLLTC